MKPFPAERARLAACLWKARKTQGRQFARELRKRYQAAQLQLVQQIEQGLAWQADYQPWVKRVNDRISVLNAAIGANRGPKFGWEPPR
jgi:hypothetical protein